MNHDLLKRVILDQHETITRERILPRAYQMEEHANYVLTGLRRSGKSMILHGLVQHLVNEGVEWNRITYINFEDERLSEMNAADLDDIVAVQSEMCGGHGYFFFDEIQNIDGWERFARRLADAKERVHITGSNAKMLSSEIEGVLGGRYLDKRIDTYSFAEYLDAQDIPHGENELLATRQNGIIRKHFDEFLAFGGLPESIGYRDRREYASSVFQKVLLGDIAARNRIRNPLALRLLAKKLAESVRNDVSYTRLHNALKSAGATLSKDTVIEYVSFIEEAYLVFRTTNYFAKFAEQESTPKYYFGDNGLLNLFLFQKETSLLENAVALHLRRNFGDGFYYLKSPKTGIDVDFYVPEAHLAIQVAYSLDDQSYDREVGNLLRLSNHFDEVESFLIVTHEDERELKQDNIAIDVIPAYKFLLHEPLV